jgi:hypothetical protein
MKSYYYVYKHGDQGPRVRHSDLEKAQAEAERLALQEPGRHFEILHCVGYASTSKASTFWMDEEEPPVKPRYMMLEVGDITLRGDEFRQPCGTWKQGIGGYSITYNHYPHRRPL